MRRVGASGLLGATTALTWCGSEEREGRSDVRLVRGFLDGVLTGGLNR